MYSITQQASIDSQKIKLGAKKIRYTFKQEIDESDYKKNKIHKQKISSMHCQNKEHRLLSSVQLKDPKFYRMDHETPSAFEIKSKKKEKQPSLRDNKKDKNRKSCQELSSEYKILGNQWNQFSCIRKQLSAVMIQIMAENYRKQLLLKLNKIIQASLIPDKQLKIFQSKQAQKRESQKKALEEELNKLQNKRNRQQNECKILRGEVNEAKKNRVKASVLLHQLEKDIRDHENNYIQTLAKKENYKKFLEHLKNPGRESLKFFNQLLDIDQSQCKNFKNLSLHSLRLLEQELASNSSYILDQNCFKQEGNINEGGSSNYWPSNKFIRFGTIKRMWRPRDSEYDLESQPKTQSIILNQKSINRILNKDLYNVYQNQSQFLQIFIKKIEQKLEVNRQDLHQQIKLFQENGQTQFNLLSKKKAENKNYQFQRDACEESINFYEQKIKKLQKQIQFIKLNAQIQQEQQNKAELVAQKLLTMFNISITQKNVYQDFQQKFRGIINDIIKQDGDNNSNQRDLQIFTLEEQQTNNNVNKKFTQIVQKQRVSQHRFFLKRKIQQYEHQFSKADKIGIYRQKQGLLKQAIKSSTKNQSVEQRNNSIHKKVMILKNDQKMPKTPKKLFHDRMTSKRTVKEDRKTLVSFAHRKSVDQKQGHLKHSKKSSILQKQRKTVSIRQKQIFNG